MFLSGLETSVFDLMRSRRRVTAFGILTFIVPAIFGMASGRLLLGMNWPASILLGAVLASHTLIAWPVVSRFGLSRHGFATATVGGTVLNNFAAMLILAIIVGQAGGGSDLMFWVRLAALSLGFAVLVFWILPAVSRFFLRNTSPDDGSQVIYILTMVFTAAFLSQTVGIESILGAFTAGLALNRLVPDKSPLMNRIQFLGNSLLVPFFLLSIGFLSDLGQLADPATLRLAVIMTLALISAKFVAAFLFSRFTSTPTAEYLMMFSLSLPQAAGTLAAVLVGVQIGVFPQSVLDGAVVMMLVTCLAGPWLTEHIGRHLARREKPAGTDRTGHILIPVMDTEDATNLFHLALLLHDKTRQGQIFPMALISDTDTAARDAGLAMHRLGLLSSGAAATNVPVSPVVRIDDDYARGIQRAVLENTIHTIILPWFERVPGNDFLAEDLSSRILRNTSERVFLCRLPWPVQTTSRMLVLVPPWSESIPDFTPIMGELKLLCRQIGDSLEIITAGRNATDQVRTIREVPPDYPCLVHSASSWHDARKTLTAMAGANDLIVVICAREDSVNWRPSLTSLPRHLISALPRNNLVCVYPALPLNEPEPHDASPDGVHLVPGPGMIAANIDPAEWPACIDRMVSSIPGIAQRNVTVLSRQILNTANDFSPELAPGIGLVHLPSETLAHSALLVATSRQGIRLGPGSGKQRPIQILLILLDNSEADTHIANLALLAHMLADKELTQALIDTDNPAAIRTLIARALSHSPA